MKKFDFDFADKTDALEFNCAKDFLFCKILPTLTYSAIAGLIVGVFVTIFNFLLEIASKYSFVLLKLVNGNLPYAPLYILGICLLGLLGAFIIKKLPEARGSGIPRTENMLQNKANLSWWRMSIATFFGSLVSFFAGLPVGSEGPSVQLGAGLASGVEKLGGKRNWSHFIANGGAAAGFATAFGAPFTGIMFVQEEVQRKFNPLMLASCCMAVAYSFLTHEFLSEALGIGKVLFMPVGDVFLPTNFLWVTIVIGVATTLVSYLFNTVVLSINKRSKKTKHSKGAQVALIVAIFFVTALIDVFYIGNFGSGLSAIRALIGGAPIDLQATLILLVVKFVMISFCFYTGATGGMMVPMLALGALTGGVLGAVFVNMGLPTECFATVVLISMCCFFGSSIKAPFTVILLFIETTHGFNGIMPLMLAVLVSTALGEILKQKPLYDTMS
ncbi:MAG: chloride channel protein, partial [Clostridia bacterium]